MRRRRRWNLGNGRAAAQKRAQPAAQSGFCHAARVSHGLNPVKIPRLVLAKISRRAFPCILPDLPSGVKDRYSRSGDTQAGSDHENLDPRYVAFFRCFNTQLFFEAHDALEPLWLEVRHDTDGDYFKGLIQVAGAFVHWQNERPGPARALLVSARSHLNKYPHCHLRLDVAAVLSLMDDWIHWFDAILLGRQPWVAKAPPRLHLASPAPPVE